MLLIAVVVVVALRERQSAQLPEAPVAQMPAEVRVKAVEQKTEPVSGGRGGRGVGCRRDCVRRGRGDGGEIRGAERRAQIDCAEAGFGEG